VRAATPAWTAALAASAIALLACGDDDDKASKASRAPAHGSAIELTIRYDDGARRSASGRLVCRPGEQRATGDLAGRPPASQRCRDARSLASLLTRQPGRRACTQVYGGPQTVHVSGTIDGRRVGRRFARTNGCEIEELARLAPILPVRRGP